MESKIIELSRYTSKDAPSNAEWTNTLSTPQKIENGDYVMIKQAFVDTRLIDNNSILIEKDVEWTLYYIHWFNNNGYSIYNYEEAVMKPDGMPYVLCNANLNSSQAPKYYGRPVIDQLIITIPAGIYERANLAEYITRQLQSVNTETNSEPVGNTSYMDCDPSIYPIFNPDGSFNSFNRTSQRVPNLVTSLQKPINACAYVSGEQPVFNGSMMYKDGSGTYTQGFLMPLCELSYYNTYPSPYYGIFPMTGTGWGNDSIIDQHTLYTNTVFYLYKGTTIGASEVAFVYNDNNGDNRFSFQYAHSPILNAGNEAVGLYAQSINDAASNNKVVYLNAHSGILFVDTFTNLSNDFNNDSFFQSLGLKYEDIVSPYVKEFFKQSNTMINHTYEPFPYSQFLQYTTRNKVTLQSLTYSASVSPIQGSKGAAFNLYSYQMTYEIPYGVGGVQDVYDFQTSTTTETIKFSNPPISSTKNAGHYLIELITSYNNEYYNDEKNYQIKAIIGTFYLSGDSFVMSMGPDSYIYQHQGEAAQLSSCKIRILNPVTKEPAGELGENSTIYLQITKEKPIPPIEEKKK